MNEPVGVLRRLSYSDINNNNIIENNEILSETDYYPFGLQHTENSIATTANKAAEKYQYNGKEFQDELNLNVFDYGARNYDAAIGRWFNVDPLAEQFAGWTPYHYVHNNPINLIDPTGMAADGWRENKETGEKTFSKDYTKANTPKEFNYADEILSGSEGKYYDSSGGITDVGTVLPEIEMTKKSSLHPYYNAVPSGEYGPSSIKIESNNPYINGSLNIASGIIGATGSIAYIGGTSGAGAVAGGALALTLSFSQINIGMAQIADGINGGNNKNLQMSSSLPGYAARQMNSPYAGIIDAGAGVLTGSLQGPALMGNIGQVSRSLQNISAGKNTYYNSYLLYSTGSSYYNFYNSAKKTSN